VKFHTSLLIAYGLAISANAQTPLGSNGQVLNHCDHQCDRKLTKDKDGNYLFEQTKTKDTCDNANLSGTKDADGKSEKVDLKCKCRIIGTYHAAKAKKKSEPAEGDKYAYAGHVDGDQADLGVNTIAKDNYSELEEHGWV
ncbi:hypothetical protein RCJ22_03275, partial [Vibrio sp. FNV 38]|nr:hypothetical protein [Vibrio sp. FNV 38]